jgi:hypothetical protein
MAIPRFDEDLAIISKLGDNPGSDNNLTTDAFRAKFDEGPQKIQQYLNEVLLPAVEQSSSPQEGLTMQGAINMNGNALTGLQAPSADTDAATKKYVDSQSINREKLSEDALYSPVLNISTAENSLTADMLGKTLMCRVTGEDFSLTISKEVHDTLPIGFEFALVYWNAASSVKIYFTGGTSACMAEEGAIENATLALPGRYSMVALKKCTSQSWLVTGNVEVV